MMERRAVWPFVLPAITLVVSAVSSAGCDRPGPGADEPEVRLRLNQIQVIGSHNSYKQAIDPSLFGLFSKDRPEVARTLDYHHPPLTEQLDLGLRALELDVFYDPEGGRYSHPAGIDRVRDAGLPLGPPFDPEGLMSAPGFKVLHVQDLDFRSSCLTLRRCLGELKAWSEDHPGHLPVAVTMNAKDQVIERPGYSRPLPFDTAALDALDAEIVDAMGRDRLLAPDDVRGDRESLEAAVLEHGWPELEWARGRFLFVLDERGDKLEAYVSGHPGLRGRTLFVDADPGRPEAGFLILNDPVRDQERIRERVEQGYLVRTRADADTAEARTGDSSRRDAAFASGAQFVSTDYAWPNPDLGTGYQVAFPDGALARCNPVIAAQSCSLQSSTSSRP